MGFSKPPRRLGGICILVMMAGASAATLLYAQGPGRGGPPTPRRHQIRQSDGQPELTPSRQRLQVGNAVSITVEGEARVIRSNGIPDHLVGAFPNRGNPHQIKPQRYEFKVPARPQFARQASVLGMSDFGVALNGVPFDPGAAEWYQGDRGSRWQYEALSGAVPLGLDQNLAHVQPTGAYHYHGIPTTWLATRGFSASRHSPLVGWAADGFPIYAVYGHSDSKDAESAISAMRSSYRLRSGARPRGSGSPGGTYDGTFVADYQYVKGHGDLDPCNGRTTVTPEFPRGTYAYFLTESWPVIPRCFRGTPSQDFEKRRPGRSGQHPRHRRGHRHPH